MRRSLASGSRAMASHASRARAGRSRQRQSKWAGSTRRCTRAALVTAPFPIGNDPAAPRSARIALGMQRDLFSSAPYCRPLARSLISVSAPQHLFGFFDGTAFFDSRPQLAGAILLKTGARYIHKQSIFEPGAAPQSANALWLFLLLCTAHSRRRIVKPPPSDFSDVPSPHGRHSRECIAGKSIGPFSRPAFQSPARI